MSVVVEIEFEAEETLTWKADGEMERVDFGK